MDSSRAELNDKRLARLKIEAHREWTRREPARSAPPDEHSGWLPVAFRLLGIPFVLVLPFLVLVRGSVFSWRNGVPAWPALGVGIALTVLLATAYGAWISHKLTGKPRVALVGKRIALPLVGCYCAYALLYLASANAKTPSVRDHFSTLHPILRVALATIIIADPDIVVTDTRRVESDYQRMGLAANPQSLHLIQDDGWVHAVDLRTQGRSAVKNAAAAVYFRVMGFDMLRHVGTADHLHISLAGGDAGSPP